KREDKREDKDGKEEKPEGKKKVQRLGDDDMTLISYQPTKPDRPAADKGDKKDLPGSADKPVNIAAFGNRLIVTSEDPEALRLVSELIRRYTTPGGEGDFEVLPLKHANATDAARILD